MNILHNRIYAYGMLRNFLQSTHEHFSQFCFVCALENRIKCQKHNTQNMYKIILNIYNTE